MEEALEAPPEGARYIRTEGNRRFLAVDALSRKEAEMMQGITN